MTGDTTPPDAAAMPATAAELRRWCERDRLAALLGDRPA